MFTGIIETTGKVIELSPDGSGINFVIEPARKELLLGMKTGDSIAVNGACMTATKVTRKSFCFYTMSESLMKTNLGCLQKKSLVNLERPLSASGSFDGHFVQGHVDTTGTIKRINKLKGSWEIFIEFPAMFKDSVIYVGSISIDGISLTVAEIVKTGKKNVLIKVAIIPHTLEVTNLAGKSSGDSVNIEFDMIGKYIKRIFENKNA